MKREVVAEGPSVAEAVDAALEQLGVQQDAVEFEVLEEGTGDSLLGGAPARVRVWLRAEAILPRTDEPGLPGAESENSEEAEGATPGDAELDALADAASEVIDRILTAFGIEADLDEYEGDDGEIILDIVGGDDLGVLIGRHGRTLDALQVLVTAIVHRTIELRHPLLVDVSGYRYRQRLKIEEIAKRGAERAVRLGKPVALRPMSSFERKIVHMCLRDDRRVATASEGEEPARQVVISPK